MAEPQTFDFDIGDVRGVKGDTGNGIKSIQLLSTSGLVKTYRITMTDDTTFDFSVSDGSDGDDGNGISGASFDPQTNALTITFDDGTSFTTPSLKGDPGSPGDDGYSPAVTIATITGGHRVTITDEAHPSGQSFDVMDGANDAGSVTYDETATYQAGSVGAELSNQSRHLSDVEENQIPELKNAISQLEENVLTTAVKDALLQIASKVAYVDDGGATYYDDLSVALGYSPVSISATFDSSVTVYDTDTLDFLKDYLTVTGLYADGSTKPIINYTLSGELTEGTSTITVTYMGKTTTVNITVVHSDLPRGYTAYDFVRNNKTNNNGMVVNTQIPGTYCDSNYEHEITMAIANNAATSGGVTCGLRSTTGSDQKSRAYWLLRQDNANKLAANYNGTDTGYVYSMEVDTKYKMVTANNQWIVNDVLFMDNVGSGSYTPYTSGYIRLFGIQTGSTQAASSMRNTLKIYGFKVKDTTTGDYIANLLPCTNGSGVAGFYDTVRKIFCTASTPSLLTAGND